MRKWLKWITAVTALLTALTGLLGTLLPVSERVANLHLLQHAMEAAAAIKNYFDPPWQPPPLSYDPWEQLAAEQASKKREQDLLTTEKRKQLAEQQRRLSPAASVQADVGHPKAPTWQRTSIYSFAYEVKRIKQGNPESEEAEKDSFFVNCVGRMDRWV